MVKQKLFVSGFLFAVFLFPSTAFAKSPAREAIPVVAMPSPVISGEVLGTMTVKKKVDYLLPYPGMLLDSPLYVLKQLRDIILERLIVDPIRKGEFYILQADKFVNMAVYLASQGKMPAVGKAVTLAEKNITVAVNSLVALKGNGLAIPARVTDRLENALAKYIEVLTEVLAKVDASQKDIITNTLMNLKKLQGELPKLK